MSRNRLGTRPATKAAFFRKVTPESAYVLGLLATDGCVYQDKQVILTQSGEDGRELLEQVQRRTGGSLYAGGGKSKSHRNSHRLVLFGRDVVDVVAVHGIVARKTETVAFPDLSRDAVPHFVRGVLDGDGCVSSWCSKGRKTPVLGVEIVTASFAFVQGLRRAVRDGCGEEMRVNRTGSAYALRLACLKAITFLDWIYRDSRPGLRLERKFHRFVDHLVLRAGGRRGSRGPAKRDVSLERYLGGA